MEIASYAISVQWGNGQHYFLRTDLHNYVEALSLFDYHKQRLASERASKISKKGAKPYVYIWRLVRA